MRIGIDARMYGPHVGGGGIGRYVQELVTHLMELDTQNEYVLFLQKANFKDCKIPAKLRKRWKKVQANVPWYSLAEQRRMPAYIRKQKLDLMHYPHMNVPIRAKTPFIATIHDLIMLEQTWETQATTLPRWKYALKQWGQRRILDHIVQNANAIVTVSNYSKGQLIHKLGASPDKVHVVYNGVESAATLAQNQHKKALRSHKLPDGIASPFFLNVGNPYPHKNIESLLHAFSFFVRAYPDVHLVLVGPENVFTKRLKEEAREIDIPENRIHFLGFVPDNLLAALYTQARGYVIPSKLEGFGIPPLEALTLGTPVAASRASSIPEILGPAATYFNPDDLEDLFRAMEQLLHDKRERTRILTASHEVLARYSWTTHAQHVLDLYQRTRA